MSENITININIMDKNYQLKCKAAEADKLKQAGQHLNVKMQAIHDTGNAVGFERTAMMAALDVCYELMLIKEERDTYKTDMDERLQKLSERVTQLIVENKIDLHPKMVGEQQQLQI